MQVRGREEVIAALTRGEVTLVLMNRDSIDEEVKALCLERDIPIEIGSSTDLWRMSADGEHEVMALVGRNPDATLDEVCANGGAMWMLDRVEYATNLGFCVFTMCSSHLLYRIGLGMAMTLQTHLLIVNFIAYFAIYILFLENVLIYVYIGSYLIPIRHNIKYL